MLVTSNQPAIAAALVQQHVTRAVEGLTSRAADGVIVFRKSNLLAFCGTPLEPTDRLVCGLINQDGKVALIVPAFEADVAGALPAGGSLFIWQEHEDPYAVFASAAKALGLEAGRILVDPHTWLDAFSRFSASLPRATLQRDDDLIRSVRIIKSREEIAAIRSACCDTGRIYPLVQSHLKAGLSERELADLVLSKLRRAGLSPWGELIQGGESASVPHQPSNSRRFQNGDAVIVDFVCLRESYLGDMTRTFAVDGVSDEIHRAYQVVKRAQRAAFEAVKPGATCEAVDAAARRVIEAADLGGYFVHRTGHGIGLDVHEPPYLVGGNRQPLEAGMCFTIEPGVYVPGRFGVRIEDVAVVTTQGCEFLSDTVPTDVSSAFA